MAGTPPPPPHFDPAGPALAGLSPNKLAYINQKLNKNLAGAHLPTIRVTTVNSRVEPPIYNPDTMNASYFFTKCEKYFRSQGFPEIQYHNMVGTILRGNTRMWYDGTVWSIQSWDDFKIAFSARFDNSAVREARKKLLYSRKQMSESCEQYITEMVTFAKQVDDTEEESVSVGRAYNGLHFELILATGSLDTLTVNTLLQKLAHTYDAIRARDQRNRTLTWLPPLYGYKLESGPQFFNVGGRGRGRGYVNQFRGHQFRPRSYSTSFPYTNNFSYGQPRMPHPNSG